MDNLRTWHRRLLGGFRPDVVRRGDYTRSAVRVCFGFWRSVLWRGRKRDCDVYFDRIQQAEKEWGVNSARLLGAVVAHELGHLLLGPHAHSHWGIMSPLWETDNVTRIGMGEVFFSGEQSAFMKRRLKGMEARSALPTRTEFRSDAHR